ncbi:sugar ABC transporter permease [Martelella lutilitoris]|uniref:Sugar ABC transporter permease n=1 Tax=Martelella lutilitoris TaxID=2583532 RepID=A0A7T7HJJ0_9HYPH|nr:MULTISPECIES: sugar ABC transporter permease [Martelella]AMM85792.1 lactose ABC transporter permease [Martelella sp. AD-3]MAM10596.1 sugar ABC transporter permease [Rhizobiaceae bacterium]QQM30307.1 sugar ABC transporter permease [Martelella lutilitoris]
MVTARPGNLRRFYDVNGWAFVAPALILIGTFMFYPIIRSLVLSFYSGRGMMMKFVGFGNIERLFNDPVFLQALTNTLTFLIIQVPVMIMLALILASALNSPKLKFRGLFRTAIFLPCVSSLVAYSILFKSMFATDGIINSTLQTLGIIDIPIPWFTDPFWAKLLIILAITWRWTGYNMIFYLAALQNIDKSIYEAARVDGVPKWRQFLHLTIPMLKPVILFTTITSTIGTLQLFDEVYNLTEGTGGPANSTLTLSLYIYNLTFRFTPNFGYAATVSYVIVVIVAILSFLQFYAARERK